LASQILIVSAPGASIQSCSIHTNRNGDGKGGKDPDEDGLAEGEAESESEAAAEAGATTHAWSPQRPEI